MAVHPLKWLFQNNLTIKEITEQHFLLNTFKIFNKQSEVAFLMQYIANALPVKKVTKFQLWCIIPLRTIFSQRDMLEKMVCVMFAKYGYRSLL